MRNLTIFEGCDCTGKTTAARAFAEYTGARYFPLGPLKGMGTIAHVYLNAMEVAISGRADVVMDRCWISEPIYGKVYRGGKDRIGVNGANALIGIADTLTKFSLVICDPGWSITAHTFINRVGDEMLDNLEQLRKVYDGYCLFRLKRPHILYDYTKTNQNNFFQELER